MDKDREKYSNEAKGNNVTRQGTACSGLNLPGFYPSDLTNITSLGVTQHFDFFES